MFHLVYYAKSFYCSSCLEGVPLEVFKKLGYCSWLSGILLLLIYSASVARAEPLHTYPYVQSHIKDTR